jgi:hypothetical protein
MPHAELVLILIGMCLILITTGIDEVRVRLGMTLLALGWGCLVAAAWLIVLP